MEENIKNLIHKKLSLLKYNCAQESHIILDEKKCAKCTTKECLFICPACVYSECDDKIILEYDNCLECGACRIACPHGAISWNYPSTKCGIIYKQS